MDADDVRSPEERFRQSGATGFRQLLTGIWRYVTRRRSLIAATLIVISVALVLAVGSSSAVGQVGLVTIGVLVTFILLPETPHRLWNVDARALAETVPGPKLIRASRDLACAIGLQAEGPVPEEAIRDIWESGLDDIANIVENPANVVFNLDYRVQLTPDDERGALVATSISAIRCVPKAKASVWFSFCSSLEALDVEYSMQGQGCIGRELVELRGHETLDEWNERVRSYRVELIVDGRPAPSLPVITKTNESSRSRSLRICFEPGPLTERFVTSDIRIEFRTQPEDHVFPIKFSSYYSLGATQVTFEIMDPTAIVTVDEYLSAAMRDVLVQRSLPSLRSQTVKIRAAEGSVLPPGTGAVFSWAVRRPVLLEQPPKVLASLVDEGAPLPSPHPLPISRQDCDALDEPLVPVTQVPTLDAYAELGILGPRVPHLRKEVASRIGRAAASLPEEFGLVILDGCRTLAEQRTLIEYYSRYGTTEGYVATLGDDVMRAPHATGGAVDLTLSWKGMPLALGTGFDEFSDSAQFRSFEATDGPVRRLRRLLASVLLEQGFVPYALEWWHWSYGDDVWAAENMRPARYDITG